METVVAKFTLIKLLGAGSTGDVYLVSDKLTSKSFAVKLLKEHLPQENIFKEVAALQVLQNFKGFPRLHSFTDRYIVMTRLGKSLNTCFSRLDNSLNPKEISYLGRKMLNRIYSLHCVQLIHRDIKPQNFLTHNKSVYLIDFGCCKPYTHKDSVHIPSEKGIGFVGTPYFASLNAHAKIQLSRRDDLESFCYILAYFCRGSLPWMNKNYMSLEEIGTIKSLVGKELFHGFPDEFQNIFDYVRSLNFYMRPDYEMICKSLKRVEKRFKSCVNRVFKNKSTIHEKNILESYELENTVKEYHFGEITLISDKLPEIKDKSIISQL